MVVLRCKVAILGDSTVGKSALSAVFQGKPFPKLYLLTGGADFAVKSVKIPETDTTVELFLFDVSGNEVYKHVRSRYMEGASFCIVCYDVTNKESFKNAKKWVDEYKAANKLVGKPKGVVLATKADLKEHAAVKGEGQEFAVENGFAYFETSAAVGKDVDTPFNFIANSFHLMYEERVKQLQSSK